MATRLIAPLFTILFLALAMAPACGQVPIQTAKIIRALEQFRIGTDTSKYFTSSTEVIDTGSTHRQIPTSKSVFDFVTTETVMIDSAMGANTGDILKWNGSAWVPQPDTIGGVGVTYYDTLRDDNVSMTQRGALNVLSTTRITASMVDDPGNNETELELDLAQQGATTGQVLKWNGAAWAPANDSTAAGGGGATDLTFAGASSPVELRSSTGTDVDFISGTGITLAGTDTTLTITNSAPDQTVSLSEGGIVDITGTYPSFTISATEVDGSVSNEGSLDVAAGGANSAAITSNTSGSPSVFIAGGTGIAVTETGDTVFVAATGGGGTPGGSNTQIQFNDGGSFGGDTLLTWDKTTNRLSVCKETASYTLDVNGTINTAHASTTAANPAINFGTYNAVIYTPSGSQIAFADPLYPTNIIQCNLFKGRLIVGSTTSLQDIKGVMTQKSIQLGQTSTTDSAYFYNGSIKAGFVIKNNSAGWSRQDVHICAQTQANSTGITSNYASISIIGNTGLVGIRNTSPAVTLDASTSTDAIAAPTGTTAQRPAVNNTMRFNTDVDGFETRYNGHWVRHSSEATPAISAGAAAGSGPSATISGNDLCGSIQLVTGTGATTGAMFTVTFDQALDSGLGVYVVLESANSNAPAVERYLSSSGNTSFTFSTVNALTDATTYVWHYHVKQ